MNSIINSSIAPISMIISIFSIVSKFLSIPQHAAKIYVTLLFSIVSKFFSIPQHAAKVHVTLLFSNCIFHIYFKRVHGE